MIEDKIKAIEEVAKTTGKGIDAGREFGGFISLFISGSLEQGMGILEDKLKYARWERQIRLIKRAKAFTKEMGIEKPDKVIPLKLAGPFFQGATLEEDDDLQDLWAKLLVNVTCEKNGVELKRVYIDILEHLTPFDAQILSSIYSLPFDDIKCDGVITKMLPGKAFPNKKSEKDFEPSEEIKLSLASLSIIGCLSMPKLYSGVELYAWVYPTLLGKKFVDACTLKKDNNIKSIVD